LCNFNVDDERIARFSYLQVARPSDRVGLNMTTGQKTKGVGAKRLTSKDAARFLGVSEASIKRWADSGLLPMQKTAGGHRRFRPEDVSVMRREKLEGAAPVQQEEVKKFKGSGAAKATTQPGSRFHLSPAREDALVQEIFQILTAGRTEELASLLVNLNLNGLSAAAIADRFLCPAMRRVGDFWYRGELGIAVEHVATRTALQGIERLRFAIGSVENIASLALCCSTEGDFHDLPVQLAATSLEEQGFEVFVLGASMPFFALSEAVERFQPRLICVTATMQLINLERAVRDYAQFQKVAQRAGSAVVLGGVGFRDPEIRSRFPTAFHAENFRQLEEFAVVSEGSEP
jgi:excisionase family DNA binding protein